MRQADLTRLGDALTTHLADVPAFDLHLGAPQVRPGAVECVANPSTGWNRLVDAIRAGAGQAWGDELPDPPYGPHLTLAYSTGSIDDDVVAQRLADAPAPGRMGITTVHLVSVTVRPQLGIFDFTTLADWDLA